MIKDYLVWTIDRQELNACYVGRLKSVKNEIKRKRDFDEGLSQIEDFPDDAYFQMDSQYPYSTLLTDHIHNSTNLIIASKEMKEFLSEENLTNLEYLPVSIRDYKGRVRSKDFYIVHPINPVDCLDPEKWDPGIVHNCENIAVIDSKVDVTRKIFKFNQFYKPVMIHCELAEKIKEKGFTGNDFCKLRDFRY
ncbi:MAG: hypothetical protein GY754_21955 [bacterium]|nr:hypothetical protein [bacterium]